ncbi:YhcN/YlaJ family sporulation lipoprotein [Alicyclobacillus macrosporangiidus]|nr:YhcN/YlaJ family sporulation lipoprotein [Alicyclobacillus macrosporangiidus]
MDFPTGQRILARPDVAASLRDGDRVADAVVLLDDGRGYVGLRLMPDARLTAALTDRVRHTVRRFAPGVGPVFVTADPHAFADLAAFQRYLVSGRTVTGILMTWRSILQRTWGMPNPSSGGPPSTGR